MITDYKFSQRKANIQGLKQRLRDESASIFEEIIKKIGYSFEYHATRACSDLSRCVTIDSFRFSLKQYA